MPITSPVAVVAKPDGRWGEVPCAFVEPVEGQAPSASELRDFCRERLARYKVPKAFVFGPVPKTATGKIPKFRLRQMAEGTATT